jgi:hypothetical protein
MGAVGTSNFAMGSWCEVLRADCFMLVPCVALLFALKMEATYSCETSVDIHRTTWRYITEDRTIRNYMYFRNVG